MVLARRLVRGLGSADSGDLDGQLHQKAFVLHWWRFGQRHPNEGSPAAIVRLDQPETSRSDSARHGDVMSGAGPGIDRPCPLHAVLDGIARLNTAHVA